MSTNTTKALIHGLIQYSVYTHYLCNAILIIRSNILLSFIPLRLCTAIYIDISLTLLIFDKWYTKLDVPSMLCNQLMQYKHNNYWLNLGNASLCSSNKIITLMLFFNITT